MLDVAKMTDEELRLANAEIDAEILRRARLEEERLWNNFVDALRAYCEKFEYIEIQHDDTIYLSPKQYDMQSFGEITPRY